VFLWFFGCLGFFYLGFHFDPNEKPVLSFMFHFNLRLKNSISVEQSRLLFHMLLLCFATEGVYIATGWLSLPHKEVSFSNSIQSYSISVSYKFCSIYVDLHAKNLNLLIIGQICLFF